VVAEAEPREERWRARVEQEIQYAEGITLADDYMRYVGDAIRDKDPDPAVLEALRSRRLAIRTYDALTAIIDAINDDILLNQRRSPGDPKKKDVEWATLAKRRQQAFGLERNLLRPLVLDLQEEQGWKPFQPNPRRRTDERVRQLLLRGDTVTPEMYHQILEEERAKADAHVAAVKAARKAARLASRAAKRGNRLPPLRLES
jgi:hypothetical protein